MGSAPPAAAVLRRALLAWGLGHLHLGLRRGWLLLAAQAAAFGFMLLIGPVLIEGSRWIFLLPPLLLIVATWVAQAVHAHQRAVELGGRPGGELQLAWLLPVVVVVVTLFWLVGGQHASPTTTLQQYVAAWRADRPAAAARLFDSPVAESRLELAWQDQVRHLQQRVGNAATRFGPFSGLDPREPFGGLRFVELEARRRADRAVFAIEIIRRERVETMLFGFVPTATQQTVLVERVGLVTVVARDLDPPPWLRTDLLRSRLWVVADVEMPVGSSLPVAP